MRIASSILGILGGFVSAILGVKWYLDSRAVQALAEAFQATGAVGGELGKLTTASYFLMGGLVVGIVGSIMVLRGKGKIGGPAMLAIALIPVAFAPAAIVFTALLALAGVLGFFSKPKQLAAPQIAPMMMSRAA